MDISSRFPGELLSEIFSYLPRKSLKFAFHNGKEANSHLLDDIKSCCLVNKRFNAIASRILYRNVTLSCFGDDGPGPELERSLLRPGHQSIQYIQSITVDICGSTRPPGSYYWPDGKFPPQEGTLLRMAKIFNRLVELVGEDRIDSIHLESQEFLMYISTPLRKKVKTFDLCLSYDNETIPTTGQEPTPIFLRSLQDLEKNKQGLSLETLTVYRVGSDLANIGPAWEICQQNYKTLKSLDLHGLRAEPNPQMDCLTRILNESHQLDALEDLCLRDIAWYCFPGAGYNSGLVKLLEQFTSACGRRNIKTLSLLNCALPYPLNTTWIQGMTSLTNLSIQKTGHLLDLEELLCNLSCGLSSLSLTWYQSVSDAIPLRKIAFTKHSKTLKRLYLDYRTGRLRIKSLPCPNEGNDILDLETISKFPFLEHLAITLDKPDSWDSGGPIFPSLKSICFLGTGLIRMETEGRQLKLWDLWTELGQIAFMNGQPPVPHQMDDGAFRLLRWLTSPYKDATGDIISKGMRLEVVIMPVFSLRLRYSLFQECLVFFRDYSKPFSFDSVAKGIDDLCYLHPDIAMEFKIQDRRKPYHQIPISSRLHIKTAAN
ncbi:hypothetical protein TWF506_004337 [Arthrobotrys conoides]|uniref:F-box domain-containing protein n=1 Tax=Arthrobotrys conoides TaxID=74498 RepID=A0AAN8P3X8_9PEZI